MNQQEHKIKRFCMAVLAHVDAGKTTLSEGLLYTGGSIRKVGRVDNKDAYFDNFELERTRGITIFSKQAQIYWKDCEITLLDTPGHVDFSAEMGADITGTGLRHSGCQRRRWHTGAYTDIVASVKPV